MLYCIWRISVCVSKFQFKMHYSCINSFIHFLFLIPTTASVSMRGLCALVFMLSLLNHRSKAMELTLNAQHCSGTTFTPNSTYQANLRFVLNSLVSNADRKNGFYNISSSAEERVFGSFMCRGDLNTEYCKACVTNASLEITKRCHMARAAIIWYDQCMLRYSNKSFFSIMEQEPRLEEVNLEHIVNPNGFMDLLNSTMYSLVHKLVKRYDHWARKFSTKNFKFTEIDQIYNFVQCTPDVSADDCSQCLAKAISYLPINCTNRIGCKILLPSCFIRYEKYTFYNTTSPKGLSKTIIAIVLSSVAAIMVLLLFGGYWFTRKKYATSYSDAVVVPEITVSSQVSLESLYFSLSVIEAATKNFSNDYKLGEGGFGAVYKGMFASGQEIAAKRLSRSSGQGEEEFKNEVESVAKLQHRNLVRLLGFCCEGQEKILVYEFVPNRSLDFHLFDPGKRRELDWQKRYRIIIGIARGLLYLHEDSRLRIVHRDLKTSNVLLDADMNPKISDFGTARIFGMNQTQENTNRIVGTYGYMSPEYVTYGNFSVKSDVFSFGVLMLEIISSKKNSSSYQSEHGEGLLDTAWKLWKNGASLELMDPTLRESCLINEVIRCIHIGLLCVQEDMEDRPTMSSVVVMLNSETISLPLPQQPAFVNCMGKQLCMPVSASLNQNIQNRLTATSD